MEQLNRCVSTLLKPESRRRLTVTILRYGTPNGRTMSFNALNKIIRLAQRHWVQSTSIRVNPNFLNGISFDLDEYVLYQAYCCSITHRNWGFESFFLDDVCRDVKNTVWVFFEDDPEGWVYKLNKASQIVDAWIPEGGG